MAASTIANSPKTAFESPKEEENQPLKRQKLENGMRFRVIKDEDWERDEELLKSENEEFNSEEYRRYYRKVKESEGFDCDYYESKHMFTGLLTPVLDLEKWPDLLHTLNSCSNLAIGKYNAENYTSYEFVKVVKANVHPVGGHLFYITFEAKDAAADGGGSLEIFQARVFVGIRGDKKEVHFCRLKPKS